MVVVPEQILQNFCLIAWIKDEGEHTDLILNDFKIVI